MEHEATIQVGVGERYKTNEATGDAPDANTTVNSDIAESVDDGDGSDDGETAADIGGVDDEVGENNDSDGDTVVGINETTKSTESGPDEEQTLS